MADASYELILFDVDDTLMDFHASENHAIQLCWERYFKEVSGLEVFSKGFRALNLQIWREVESGKLKPPHVSYERARRTLKNFGLGTRDAADLGAQFAEGLSRIARWLPGAEKGFKSIAARHKVGLVTNGLSSVQNPRISALGIRSVLSTVQISEEVGTLKPRAEIFFRAIEESKCSAKKTLMVGDSLSSDFQGAINAGLDFCWLNPNSHGLPHYLPKPRYHVNSVMELESLLA